MCSSDLLLKYPSNTRLEEINRFLLSIDGVQKAESFNKSHSQVFRLLLIVKWCVIIFGSLIGVLSFLLMLKQIEIWRFEHSERMEIMSYLGAPAWVRNGILFRLALFDSAISVFVITFVVYYLSASKGIMEFLATLEIETVIFDWMGDFFFLLMSGIVLSTASVLIVIIFQREK